MICGSAERSDANAF